jgi:VanZ family protein
LEGIQFLLPYRSWNVNDALGNAVGVVMGCVLVGVMKSRGQAWVVGLLGME